MIGGIYEEFAAVFWELRYFAWNALPRYFPSLEDLDEVAAVLSQDVDAQWLYLTTRPLNAPDPVDRSASDDLGGMDWKQRRRPFAAAAKEGAAFGVEVPQVDAQGAAPGIAGERGRRRRYATSRPCVACRRTRPIGAKPR